MKTWIVYAAMTLFAWGLWGFFSKLGSADARPRQSLLFQAVGALAFALLVLAIERFRIDWSPTGFGWSALAGFVNFCGFLAFFAAIDKGKVSTVITMSSLYPVITILLSVAFLHEKISAREGLGIGFAIVASLLLS